MKAFKVTGKMRLTPGNWQKFSKEFIGKDQDEAVERAYSILGSKHKMERKFIIIEGIKELNTEEVEDPVVKYRLESGA